MRRSAFVLLMIFFARRLLGGLERKYDRVGGIVSQDMPALILLVALASAWVREWLGIHALFGAFLAGAVMPRGDGFVSALTEKLEGFTVVLFLPLFSAFTGLRTSIGLVSGAEMWGYCALIVGVAVAGKFGGSTIAARLMGMLVNTRGLMELVILNVGLEIGVISPAPFTMMVLMALVTTFMTTPLLVWIYPPAAQGKGPAYRMRSRALEGSIGVKASAA